MMIKRYRLGRLGGEKMERPNIVLLMADEFRGDCIGAAGHPDVKTPYLDTLLSGGVYFKRAYTSCPSCVPARAAMFTGLSQEHHGRVGYRDCVPWNYDCTLAGELSKCGYYTQCVGKMHVHPLRSLQGFHHVELHDGYLHNYRRDEQPFYENQLFADDYFHWLKEEKGISCDVTDTGLDCNSWVARPWCYEEKYHPTNWVTSRSIDFLRRRDRDKPFFLMASYVRPHAPYDAPQAYFDLYKDRDLRPPFKGDWDDEENLKANGYTFNSSTGPLDPVQVRRQQEGYYACITHLDHQIGRLMLSLIEHDLMDNTIIAFVADHGELLSDHGLCRKSRAYEGSIHIPLILYGPERFIGKPRVCEDLAELRDILPTLVALAGGQAPDCVDGVNLLAGEASDRSYLHGEHTAGAFSNQFIVTKEDKYIWYTQSGEERYFRLDTDPTESHNAIHDAEYAERIDELRSCLIRELDGREEGYSDGKKLIPGRPPQEILHRVLG